MKRHTQIGLVLLAMLMLMRSLVIPLVYLDYQLRKDYIKNYLCVNRDKPQLHCDGKCYLAKRIAAAQEQEQRQAERDFFKQLFEVPATLTAYSFDFQPTVWSYRIESPQVPYLSSLSEGTPMGIFHPPSWV
ncbi:MAG: hypothetical protein U0Y10_12110 [Spirosomataceae bacterium]